MAACDLEQRPCRATRTLSEAAPPGGCRARPPLPGGDPNYPATSEWRWRRPQFYSALRVSVLENRKPPSADDACAHIGVADTGRTRQRVCGGILPRRDRDR